MKFNISYPLTGAQKTIEVDDDKKCAVFFDRRMGQQVEADSLGDEYKGYVFKITGGNDKQGFPMRQGVLFKGRVQILMRKGHKGYRPRRSGEMKRKSIRGCIVGPDIRVLAVQLVKKGEKDIDGLTNVQVPQRLGPKRLTRIRKLFGFKKTDGVALVKKSVIRRTWEKNGKKHNKAAKIQRLVTESRLRRKVIAKKTKEARWAKSKSELEAYKKLAHDIHEAKKRHRKASSEIREKAKQETKPVVPQKQAPPQKQAVVPPQKQAVKQPVVAAQKPAPVTAKKGGK